MSSNKSIVEVHEEVSAIEGICETIYISSHPDVLIWTKVFHDRLSNKNIFKNYNPGQGASFETAKAVGVNWYQFSKFMPWFLCQAAAMVSTNEKRHYVIQTAFEELGMRRADKIHPELFWSTVELSGATKDDLMRITSKGRVEYALQKLKNSLLSYKSDASVLGILLGLEIPAVENIETIYNALAYSNDLKNQLDSSEFFILHRQIEIEHVRLTVSNFLRFCPDENSRKIFIDGFDDGIEFWSRFWTDVSLAILDESERIKL